MECPECEKDALKHLHDSAHGIPGTHMEGSERFECECGFYVGDKETAVPLDFLVGCILWLPCP